MVTTVSPPQVAPAHPSPAGLRTVLVYEDGRVRDDISAEDIDTVLGRGDAIVWLDIEQPTESCHALLATEFNIHPLAIEDVRTPHQRPKLDRYDDSRLIVLFDAQLTPHAKRVALREVDIFIGPGYLITFHRAPIHAIHQLRERWKRQPSMIEACPLGFLLYYLTDNLVDSYFPIADTLNTRLEAIEERLFVGFDRAVLKEIFNVRRDVIQLRKVLAPQRDVFNMLSRRGDPMFDATTDAYFADVVDLVQRVTETVDTMRELLAATMDWYLSLQSNALNNIMKRLTGLTVTLMVPTLIAGVYGMNFEKMPELGWTFGYPFALTLMVIGAIVTLMLFRRNDWL